MNGVVGGCEDVGPNKVKGDASAEVFEYGGGRGVGEIDRRVMCDAR